MFLKPKIGWYALYVKPRSEKKVNKLLLKKNIEVYLPLVKKLKKWSDRKKEVLEPLIPSYIFVRANSPQDFINSLSVDGACCFIKFGNTYARIKDEEIDNIKLILSGDYKDVELIRDIPKSGEIKEIQHGLLTGLKCEVLKVENVRKVLVRISSISMNITATLPMKYLQKTPYSNRHTA